MTEYLTIEESQKLIDYGLNPNNASKVAWQELYDNDWQELSDYDKKVSWRSGIMNKSDVLKSGRFETHDIFTFGDLYDILPKRIEDNDKMLCAANILITDDTYCVLSYMYSDNSSLVTFGPNNLISVVKDAVIWCLKNGYIESK